MKALQSRRLSFGLLIFLILLGPAFAFLTYFLFAQYEQNHLEDRFTEDVSQRVASLESEIAANLEVLYSLEALYNASQRVTRDEFMTFAEGKRQRHPAIYALEWIPRVSAAQRANHEFRARRDGLSDYRVSERANSGELVRVAARDYYFPIYYIAPETANDTALGFDVASNPARRSVLNEAMSEDTLVVTDPVPLGDGESVSATFLGLLPVYQEQPDRTFPDRLEKLEGFVLGVFQVRNILQRSLLPQDPEQPAQMAFRLVDPQVNGQPVELFNSLSEQQVSSRAVARRVTIQFGPQTWELDAYPTATYLTTHGTYRPIILGISVLLIWELIVGVIAALMKRAADLAQLARQDPLTGLANRRYFVEQVQAEWQRAQRTGEPMSVIMVDVDWFKTYNDNHGHRAGDQCLQRLATALQAAASRSTDLVCRYGGEEFVLLLPNSAAPGALVVAEKIRAAIEDLEIPQTKAEDSPFVTVSLGCATQDKIQAEQDWEPLIASADQALYQAKQKGRNRLEQAAVVP